MNTIRVPNAGESLERLRECLPVQRRDYSLTRPLAELGLDSLDTVEFLCAVHAEFGVRLQEQDFHPGQTLEGLLAAITKRREQS